MYHYVQISHCEIHVIQFVNEKPELDDQLVVKLPSYAYGRNITSITVEVTRFYETEEVIIKNAVVEVCQEGVGKFNRRIL